MSNPATGPSFHVSSLQENNARIVYSAGWLARLAQSSAFGGFVRPTTKANASATLNFTGARNVAAVLPRRSSLGTARACLFDGSTQLVCRTIDLSPSTGLGARKVVFTRDGLNPTHPYRLRISDSAGRIELDAVALFD